MEQFYNGLWNQRHNTRIVRDKFIPYIGVATFVGGILPFKFIESFREGYGGDENNAQTPEYISFAQTEASLIKGIDKNKMSLWSQNNMWNEILMNVSSLSSEDLASLELDRPFHSLVNALKHNNDSELTSSMAKWIIHRLVEAGYDINQLDNQNFSPLDIAFIQNKSPEQHIMMEALLFHGAKYNHYKKTGETPRLDDAYVTDAVAQKLLTRKQGLSPGYFQVDENKLINDLFEAANAIWPSQEIENSNIPPLHMEQIFYMPTSPLTIFSLEDMAKNNPEALSKQYKIDDWEGPPINYFAFDGRWLEVAALLKAGVRADYVDTGGYFPLYFLALGRNVLEDAQLASTTFFPNLAKLLIKRGPYFSSDKVDEVLKTDPSSILKEPDGLKKTLRLLIGICKSHTSSITARQLRDLKNCEFRHPLQDNIEQMNLAYLRRHGNAFSEAIGRTFHMKTEDANIN